MTAGEGPHTSMLHRGARTICPRTERAWVDAMFAELDAVEESGRTDWILGAFSIVLSGLKLRAASVPLAIWLGIVLAFGAVVLLAFGSRSGCEGLLMVDDVFLGFAWVSGVLLVGLAVLAINWMYNHTDTKPRHRH